MAIVNKKHELFTFEEVESLFVAQDTRIERFKQLRETVPLNMTQAMNTTDENTVNISCSSPQLQFTHHTSANPRAVFFFFLVSKA